MIKLALLASGSGSNAEAIAAHFRGNPQVKVYKILTNNANAGVLERAKRLQIPSQVFSPEAENETVLRALLADGVTHVVLAGYLKKIPASWVAAFPDRIVNIHPALLPKFGGKGMYGHRVHQAVFEAGERESGITVHKVNEAYDEGAIIAHFRVQLTEQDTPESIESKVRALELAHFAPTLERFFLENTPQP